MTTAETLLSVGVIIAFGIWAYSKVKQQSLNDTIKEMKDIFQSIEGDS